MKIGKWIVFPESQYVNSKPHSLTLYGNGSLAHLYSETSADGNWFSANSKIINFRKSCWVKLPQRGVVSSIG